MTIENIDIQATIEKAQTLIQEDKQLSSSTKSIVEILIVIISLLANRLNLNSSNSSKPPASDPSRKRQPKKKTDNKTGGQKGHNGTTLKKVDNPDVVEEIKIDRRKLPAGQQYHPAGFETRQVFDIDISRIVTEYRAQILKDQDGKQYVAPFPEGVTKAVQYGPQLKAHSVYMSQYQLIPYNRVQEYFADQLNIPISKGSIFNFNKEAFQSLADFEKRVHDELKNAKLAHADETGINVGSKRHWLHCLTNDLWTGYFPHVKRGTEAMNDMGILPDFKGILCHDHWKPYFKYGCTHSLCNAHHLRELERAWEQDEQQWAKQMKTLLEEINSKVIDAGGALDIKKSQEFRETYRKLLKQADIECPEPPPKEKGKRGRAKRSKSRNLLERLRNFEDDVLRFIEIDYVPFTNNLGERDIRMTKVQQKISGCFRSIDGARIFCRVRGYLSTCRKHGVSSSHALGCLFKGSLPDFLLHD